MIYTFAIWHNFFFSSLCYVVCVRVCVCVFAYQPEFLGLTARLQMYKDE